MAKKSALKLSIAHLKEEARKRVEHLPPKQRKAYVNRSVAQSKKSLEERYDSVLEAVRLMYRERLTFTEVEKRLDLRPKSLSQWSCQHKLAYLEILNQVIGELEAENARGDAIMLYDLMQRAKMAGEVQERLMTDESVDAKIRREVSRDVRNELSERLKSRPGRPEHPGNVEMRKAPIVDVTPRPELEAALAALPEKNGS